MSYESQLLHDWYIAFHYAEPEDIVRGSIFEDAQLPKGCFEFPVATVDFFDQSERVERALDIGCAVGRSSFELSRVAEEVIGIDFSQAFVDAAAEVQKCEPYPYRLYWEGHLGEEKSIIIPESSEPDRVSFEQGDAMQLRDDIGQFDLVHAANLMCRLPEPLRFINRLPDLVKSGGKLVMATPATWLPEYTPVENMPAGETLDFLQEHLADNFELKKTQEVPFFIREHKRKFQLSSSQTTLWVRK